MSSGVEELAQVLRQGVGTCEASPHVMNEVWTNLVVNCGGNLLASITSWDTRELSLNHTARLRWSLQSEAVAVGEHTRRHLRVGSGGSIGVILTAEDIIAEQLHLLGNQNVPAILA